MTDDALHEDEHTDDTRVHTHLPTNVIAALARVEAEIGGIQKLSPEQHAARRGQRASERGISYSYRGIDQIAQAAQPLLGRYGVVIVPEVENHVIDEIEVGGKPWTDTTVTVLWNIYGPDGVNDKITARTIGYGRDNSDKGMNKAMTGAYKNLLLRILSIGDPQDDTDHERHETGVPGEPVIELLTDEQAQHVVDAVLALEEPHKTEVKNAIAEGWGSTKQIPASDWDAVQELLAAYAERTAQDAATEPVNPEPDEEAAAAAEGHHGQDATYTDGEREAVEAERRRALAEQKLAEAGLADDEPDPQDDTPDHHSHPPTPPT